MSAFVIISLYNSYFSSTAHADVPRPDHMERLSYFLVSTITNWLFVSLVFVFSLSTVSDRIGKVWNVLVSNYLYLLFIFYKIFLHNQVLQEPADSKGFALTDSLEIRALVYLILLIYIYNHKLLKDIF